jgi:hypothetical protein
MLVTRTPTWWSRCGTGDAKRYGYRRLGNDYDATSGCLWGRPAFRAHMSLGVIWWKFYGEEMAAGAWRWGRRVSGSWTRPEAETGGAVGLGPWVGRVGQGNQGEIPRACGR